MNQDPNTQLSVVAPAGSSITTAEATAQAQSAREIAQVQAKFAMARRFPRNDDDFRVQLLARCKSSDFAKVARYSLPRGGKTVEGPSIRFVEEAIRKFGNLEVATDVLVDDHEKRMLRVGVLDLEANIAHSITITVPKTMDRKNLQPGERPISSRKNSFGETVYLLPAPDDEVTVKQNSAVSKALRTQGLRVLPGEVVAEAMALVIATLRAKVAQDPEGERKSLIDAFAVLRVMPSQLGEYLGMDLEQASPADLVELRGLYVAIKDGAVRFADALDAKRPPAPDAPKADPAVEAKKAETQARLRKATEMAAAKKAPKKEAVDPKTGEVTDAPPLTQAPEAKPTPKPDASPAAGEAAAKHDPTTHDGQEPPADWKPGGAS